MVLDSTISTPSNHIDNPISTPSNANTPRNANATTCGGWCWAICSGTWGQWGGKAGLGAGVTGPKAIKLRKVLFIN